MHMNFTYRFAASAALTIFLAGCASTSHHAPVEDRSRAGTPGSAASGTPVAPRVLPGAENAGKPGYYTVKKGDTLIRISLDAGQRWRDLAVWNNLENPNLIEEGQVLRVVPPGADASAGATAGVSTKPIGSPKIEGRNVDAKGNVTGKPASGVVVAAVSGASGAASSASAAASAAAESKDAAKDKDKDASVARDADEPAWNWPANGPTLSGFEEGKRKGLAIGGKAGDPVYAAADGSVVYAGSGLRGYGNLIIVKHNGEYLTAYAHNQTLLVKEDQSVRKGQKIAEMGSTDADRVQLHFEIRKRGKPIDPGKQLPSR
ncbi:MAG: peptidoglycan DD-metalloendopeptidase family protein [Aquabacterium sp.]|uniref:peptidoglycan DD-metalloendopeptidase family protein n=1 Tax=Aquabacterium sp. TaxID=1872578 RepID=UPI0025C5CEFF|nr:peptidoglycan DD-metalloendopeptidase family protein [Aquabacterium sp.]MBI5924389.1 peptidoglycan DD-metalloendopeptidase family protein [Aquabacterium sp.]